MVDARLIDGIVAGLSLATVCASHTNLVDLCHVPVFWKQPVAILEYGEAVIQRWTDGASDFSAVVDSSHLLFWVAGLYFLEWAIIAWRDSWHSLTCGDLHCFI